jgi:hypothetical protein
VTSTFTKKIYFYFQSNIQSQQAEKLHKNIFQTCERGVTDMLHPQPVDVTRAGLGLRLRFTVAEHVPNRPHSIRNHNTGLSLLIMTMTLLPVLAACNKL